MFFIYLFSNKEIMISEMSRVTLDSRGELKQWNNKNKRGNLWLGNDYKRVSSPGRNKLHYSGYFSHPPPLNISQRHRLWRRKSY